jgi:hypothetical protein
MSHGATGPASRALAEGSQPTDARCARGKALPLDTGEQAFDAGAVAMDDVTGDGGVVLEPITIGLEDGHGRTRKRGSMRR